MATEVISTVQPSGGDYTTLTAWEAGEQRNLVSADEIATAECYDFALTDDFAISGWTTDATRYIKIYAPTAERHNGTARAVGGSGFSITPSGGAAANSTIRVAQSHVYIEGLDVVGTSSSQPVLNAVSGAGNIYVDACIIHDTKTGTGYTVLANISGVALRMRNSMVYGSCRSADLRDATSVLLENCIFWRHAAQLGVLMRGSAVVRNSYSGHAGGASEDWWTGGSGVSGNNNASGDSTAATLFSSSLTSVASSVLASTTTSSEDLHLAAGTNALVGAGTNLYASFTEDIDGDTWPSSGAWDIGADYRYSASALPTLTAINASLITTTGARLTVT